MKTCNDCQLAKPLDDFNWRSKVKETKQPYCRICQRKRNMGDYFKSPERYAKNKTAWKQRRQDKLLAYLAENSCVDCGETDPVVLEFDHRERDEKSFGIAQAISGGWAWELIEQELAKCDVRCANCHKRVTAKQFGWYKAMQV